ncbi:MAG: hypothetical protein IJ861_03510 [Clostridia bacterium]|nr:hypothetical protein [Clostridia bacterium]
MPTTIAKIIENDNVVIRRVSDFQKMRILELQDMLKRQQQGEEVDTSAILKRWQETGILDENGDFTEPYRIEE